MTVAERYKWLLFARSAEKVKIPLIGSKKCAGMFQMSSGNPVDTIEHVHRMLQSGMSVLIGIALKIGTAPEYGY